MTITDGASGLNGGSVTFDPSFYVSKIWGANIKSYVGRHYVSLFKVDYRIKAVECRRVKYERINAISACKNIVAATAAHYLVPIVSN